MNNILIFGKNGQVASNLIRLFAEENTRGDNKENNFNVHSYSSSEVDFADLSALKNFLNNLSTKPNFIINAAAYTHTSIAIRDALEIFNGAKVELHISNIFKREEFRQTSFLSDVVDAVISGFGIDGYTLALLGIHNLIRE